MSVDKYKHIIRMIIFYQTQPMTGASPIASHAVSARISSKCSSRSSPLTSPSTSPDDPFEPTNAFCVPAVSISPPCSPETMRKKHVSPFPAIRLAVYTLHSATYIRGHHTRPMASAYSSWPHWPICYRWKVSKRLRHLRCGRIFAINSTNHALDASME